MKIVPVVNKIDLPNANPEAVKDQLFNLFEIYPDDVIEASAKTGISWIIFCSEFKCTWKFFYLRGYGVEDIFEAVVDKIPPPNKHNSLSSLRFFLQDSWYDIYRGTVVSTIIFAFKHFCKQFQINCFFYVLESCSNHRRCFKFEWCDKINNNRSSIYH